MELTSECWAEDHQTSGCWWGPRRMALSFSETAEVLSRWDSERQRKLGVCLGGAYAWWGGGGAVGWGAVLTGAHVTLA